MSCKILFLLLAIAFMACTNNKKYKYIQIDEEVSLLGGTDRKEKEPKTILASNDSMAYLDAYQSFCIAKKVDQDMKKENLKNYSTPLDFKLLDEKGNDITNLVAFASKAEKEKEIEERVFSRENVFSEAAARKNAEEQNNFKQTAYVDSGKVKELTKFFAVDGDEFSNTQKRWYKPKSAPKFTNRNGLYCYFQTEQGMPSNLRFRMQYYSDDWLFIEKVQFSIDGKAYDYFPMDVDRDNGDGGYIWEWFDEHVGDSDKGLIRALASAKSAKMKLVGRQYYDIKTVTPDQINAIKRTLELYQALGGSF